MARTPGGITPDKIAVVKKLLMEGRSQAHVAAVVGIGQASVSRIKKGDLGADVPWPGSGKTGALPTSPAEKRIERWSPRAAAYMTFNEDMQQHILDVVNEHRRQAGIGEIPPAAPLYLMYLQSEDSLTPDEVVDGLEDAVQAEDNRLCQLMEEFQALLDVEAQRSRDRELFDLLSATSENGRVDSTHPITSTSDIEYDALTLEQLLELAGKVPIVAEALEQGSLNLELACRIIFYQLRGSDPKTFKLPFVEKEVRRLATKLKERV
jgi:hypothetical protein